jgi:hypothetical protein
MIRGHCTDHPHATLQCPACMGRKGEDQRDGAPPPRVPGVQREDQRGADQHRDVRIVAAGVHHALHLGREVEAGLLMDRERIHVRAQQDGRAGRPRASPPPTSAVRPSGGAGLGRRVLAEWPPGSAAAGAICLEHGFTARLGNALMHRGAARAHLGELEEGIEDFREGRAIWRGSGVVFHAPEHAAELAGLLLMAGRVAEGHAVLEDVEGLVAGTDEAACLAECQRLRGMIAVADGDVATAERWLNTAIATARGQGAALFELRAMTRLTELLATQGREADAVRRLGDVYASFTQGHGAPDLQEAKAVLDRLRT